MRFNYIYFIILLLFFIFSVIPALIVSYKNNYSKIFISFIIFLSFIPVYFYLDIEKLDTYFENINVNDNSIKYVRDSAFKDDFWLIRKVDEYKIGEEYLVNANGEYCKLKLRDIKTEFGIFKRYDTYKFEDIYYEVFYLSDCNIVGKVVDFVKKPPESHALQKVKTCFLISSSVCFLLIIFSGIFYEASFSSYER